MSFKRFGEKSGVALIMAMWIMTILMVVATSFAFMMRTELKMATNFRNEMQTYYLALAGVEYAIALLRNDGGSTDNLTETWYTSTTGAGEITLAPGTYTVIVEDESGKINLNTADNESLDGLEEVDSSKAAAIIDYPKDFDTIRELPKCPEVGIDVWNGKSTNDYDQMTHWNKDAITVYTTPIDSADQININTAAWYALRGLFDGDAETGLSDREIYEIRNYVDDTPLETISIANLDAIPYISNNEATALAAGNQLKVTSEGFFRIISTGYIPNADTPVAQRKIEAVVYRGTPIQIKYWSEQME